jgi:hypothetical protein
MARVTQLSHVDWSRTRLLQKYRAFLELLDGPNGLTPQEIEALYKKRPNFYAFLEKWVEPCD